MIQQQINDARARLDATFAAVLPTFKASTALQMGAFGSPNAATRAATMGAPVRYVEGLHAGVIPGASLGAYHGQTNRHRFSVRLLVQMDGAGSQSEFDAACGALLDAMLDADNYIYQRVENINIDEVAIDTRVYAHQLLFNVEVNP